MGPAAFRIQNRTWGRRSLSATTIYYTKPPYNLAYSTDNRTAKKIGQPNTPNIIQQLINNLHHHKGDACITIRWRRIIPTIKESWLYSNTSEREQRERYTTINYPQMLTPPGLKINEAHQSSPPSRYCSTWTTSPGSARSSGLKTHPKSPLQNALQTSDPPCQKESLSRC